jgi:tetratricopeptide (TPR) repeat protein
MRTGQRVLLSLVLAFGSLPLRAQAPAASDPEVVKGVKLVDEGDYDAAILALDAAARRLAADPTKGRDLSQAYLYLGIAYVGKGQEAAARARFREALAQIKDLSLSPDRFPPKVIDVFEAAKEEMAKAAPAVAPKPAAAPKKGGGGKTLLIVGGLAAVGGGVALAAGGGGGGSSTPADTRRVETFTGSLCNYSFQEANGGCDAYRGFDVVVGGTGTLDATITWSDGNIFFQMLLQDQDFNDVARSNRTTNTSSQLTASVRPQTGCAGCAYHLYVERGDSAANGAPAAFNLTVRHP